MVPAVRVVILNFNGGDHVMRCVEHALALDWPEDRLEIVVVDNASSDGSPQAIEKRFPTARVLHHATNTGFPANNLALRDLDDVAYVALVNPDAFVEPDWLVPLVETLEADHSLGGACPRMLLAPRFVDLPFETTTHTVPGDSRALGVRVSGIRVAERDVIEEVLAVRGVSGPETDRATLRYHWTEGTAVLGLPLEEGSPTPSAVEVRLDSGVPKSVLVGKSCIDVDDQPRWYRVEVEGDAYDVVNNAGSILVEGGFGADRGLGDRDGPAFDEPCDVFAWCGGGVLLRADYLRDVGLFDEDFFLYYEDTDLSWRGQGLGWRYRYVPSARMRHLHGASTVVGSPLFVFHVERNRLLMLLKNAPAGFAMRGIWRYCCATVGVARHQIVRPVLAHRRPEWTTTRLRLAAFVGMLRLLPSTLGKRRRIRASMVVDDAEILAWQVPQP